MLNMQQTKMVDEIEKMVERHGGDRKALLPILQEMQARYHTISDFAMQAVADRLGIDPVEVYGVVTFYAFLNEKYHGRFVIRLCRTVCCDMAGKDAVAQQLRNDLGVDFGETTPDGRFTLGWANCIGMCDQGPAMLINEQVFTQVTPEAVRSIIAACGKTLSGVAAKGLNDAQTLTIRNHMSLTDVGDGVGLRAALAMSPAEVIEQIRESGMKGRGGAGFPTASKWAIAAAAPGERKYVVCNADEGEPGTFKDRVILGAWPDRVFEGMTLAGYAIGASHGIVYLRGEYAYLRQELENRLAHRREAGLLGASVAGKSGFSFDIHIHMGCGSYVCGEETALIESIEGRRGEARNRPPFPVTAGLDGAPTLVNNVETFAWAAAVLANGPQWFKSSGTNGSAGPKMLSVSGDVARPGVYEFPLGVTIAEVLKEAGAENAKAVVVGGASGRCVPASEFSRAISYEDVPTGGAIIVFGENRDMLQVAENFLEFFVDESCGQCTPCRIGNIKLLEGARMLREGKCSSKYLEELLTLGETMQVASKCGLGQTSPNFFLSIARHFRKEILGRTPVAA